VLAGSQDPRRSNKASKLETRSFPRTSPTHLRPEKHARKTELTVTESEFFVWSRKRKFKKCPTEFDREITKTWDWGIRISKQGKPDKETLGSIIGLYKAKKWEQDFREGKEGQR